MGKYIEPTKEMPSIKVRAKGPSDRWAGEYNHHRIRGGDVFNLVPIETMKEVPTGETVKDRSGKREIRITKLTAMTISPEKQFSERWMEKINTNEQISKPSSSKNLGRSDGRVMRQVSEQSDTLQAI